MLAILHRWKDREMLRGLEDILATSGESRDGGSDFASKAGSRIGAFPEPGARTLMALVSDESPR